MLALGVAFGIFGSARILTPVGFTLGIWIVLTSLVDPIDRWRRKLTLSRSILGMTVAHLGLAMFVIGITSVESYTHEQDIALAPGQTARHRRLRGPLRERGARRRPELQRRARRVRRVAARDAT